jgi:hypothetical protein
MTGRKVSDVERWQAAGMVIGGMSANAPVDNPSASQRVRIAE